MGRGSSKVGGTGGGGTAKISNIQAITKSINEEPLGTKFYFEDGTIILKTQDDYGFSGTLPMFRVTTADGKRIMYWGKWATRYQGVMSDKLTQKIKTFGALKKVEHGSDPYRVTPMFT